MTNERFYDEDYIINLTIDGTPFQNVEVKVTEPNKTIRNQIDRIVQVFDLPKSYNGGTPIQYLLGRMLKDRDEPEILDFEDEEGQPETLLNYDIKSGDRLCLISPPLYGC